MKKFVIFLSSILCFIGIFSFSSLRSFADESSPVFPGWDDSKTIKCVWATYNSSGRMYYFEGVDISPEVPIFFIADSNNTYADAYSLVSDNVVAGHYKTFSKYQSSLAMEAEWGSQYNYTIPSNSYFDVTSNGTTRRFYRVNIGRGIPSTGNNSNNQVLDGTSVHVTNDSSSPYRSPYYQNVVIFRTMDIAKLYFDDPDGFTAWSQVPVGEDILKHAGIDWGNDDPSNPGSKANSNIPAPVFNIVYDENGSGTHSIKFTNKQYNTREMGNPPYSVADYGLVLKASWCTVDNVTLEHTGSLMDTTFKVYTSTLLDQTPIFTVFDIPTTDDNVNPCPYIFNFDTNSVCIDYFNQMLVQYPTSSRLVSDGGWSENEGPSTTFMSKLGQISFPYNTVAFSCFYYRKMPDGTYAFGPTSSGHFDLPVQGAIFEATATGGVIPGTQDPYIPGGNPGITPGPVTPPAPGPVDVPGVGDITNLDPSDLYNSMNGILTFVGEVPQFMAQIFTFLPSWLIGFIAIAIGLMIVIGVVKLFLG